MTSFSRGKRLPGPFPGGWPFQGTPWRGHTGGEDEVYKLNSLRHVWAGAGFHDERGNTFGTRELTGNIPSFR